MENFSKRTTASLFVTFILLVVGWGLWMEKAAEPLAPPVHCDRHLVFTPGGKT